MDITKKQLLHGCLLSSIAHAIMTNIYPELSYEQSWDENNFSVQNGDGLRGTLTFLENTCIGAIRDESGNIIYGIEAIIDQIKSFPKGLIDIAKANTLQYLCDYHKGLIVPAITSIFWCDNRGLHLGGENIACFENDFILFHACALPENKEIEVLKDYYGMNSASLRLLHELLLQKEENISKKIVLSESQKEMIPGSIINNQCRESFYELNIFVK